MKAHLYSKFKKESALGEASINLTPLIDVVFVVLVMFIIVAPLLEIDSIELAQASEMAHNSIRSDTGKIHIHVKADDSILINKTPIAKTELRDRLAKLKEYLPNERPQVYHDKRARFGTYQDLKNILEELGFEEMDIILQPS